MERMASLSCRNSGGVSCDSVRVAARDNTGMPAVKASRQMILYVTMYSGGPSHGCHRMTVCACLQYGRSSDLSLLKQIPSRKNVSGLSLLRTITTHSCGTVGDSHPIPFLIALCVANRCGCKVTRKK